VKPHTNSIEVHPQLSNNKHPMDGALVGASSLWLFFASVFRKPVGALDSLGNLTVDIVLFIKNLLKPGIGIL
jgi:hypothetical protein